MLGRGKDSALYDPNDFSGEAVRRGGAALLLWLALGAQQLWSQQSVGQLGLPGDLRGFESPPAVSRAQPTKAGGCGGEGPIADVYLHSGELHHEAVDLRIPGRGLDFVWGRKYRSRLGPNTAQGNGWDFSYDIWIEAAGSDVRVHDGNTRADIYLSRADGTYTAEQFFREGNFNPDGTFTLTFADTGTWDFLALDGSPAAGKIQSIVDRNGNALMFAYGAGGRLMAITDTLNRQIQVGYDGTGHISTLTDYAGRQVKYSYYQSGDAGGSEGDLKSATTPAVVGTPNGNDFPEGKTTTYTYSKGFADADLNHNLLSITDPKGQTWLVNTYASATNPRALLFDRLVKQVRGGPTDSFKLVYVPLFPKRVEDTSPEVMRVIANDPVGNVREYFYDAANRLVKQREFTGRADPSIPTTASTNRPTNPLRGDDPAFFERRWSYNADSQVIQIVHPNGNLTERVYELDIDPQASWRSRGNLREIHRLPGTHAPVGDQASLSEYFKYETGFGGCCGTNFVSEHTDARGSVTMHLYDSSGNRLRTTHRIPSIVEDWEYNAFGQSTAHVLPDNGSGWRRRDESVYYGRGDGAQNGYLRSEVMDAAGFALTTTYEYDAVGNVVRTVDPKGNDELYTVNALDQVVKELSREVDMGDGVRYEKLTYYDANDNVVRVDVQNIDDQGVLQPNTHFTTSYEYEILNHVIRMTEEVDPTTNVVVDYAYDANRNRTLERKGEATGGSQPANTVTTLHDERDLVWRVIEAQGAAEQATVQYDYDGNGSTHALREGLEDATPHVTLQIHDSYGRVVSVTDAMGNDRLYHYDANGNLGGNASELPPIANPFAMQVRGELADIPGWAGNLRLSELMHTYDPMDRRTREDARFFDTQTQVAIGDGQSSAHTSYSDNSQVLSVTHDSTGHVTTSSYDTANRLSIVTDARNNAVTYSYDENSNLIAIVELERSDLASPEQSFTTTRAYDALDRLSTTTDNGDNTHLYFYDSRDNRLLEVDARGNETRYSYDGLNRLVQTVRDMNGNGAGGDAPDIVFTQTWDASSRRTAQSDDNGNATRYAYDALDRVIVMQMADGTIQQIGTGAVWPLDSQGPDLGGFVSGYNVHGNRVLTVDANGSRVDSAFDLLNRATTRAVSPGPEVLGTTLEIYQYDGLSRLVRAQDDDSLVTRGSAATSGYDSLSNVLRETQRILPGGPVRTVTAEYDGDRNQTKLIYPGGRVISRVYDTLDRPVLVREGSAGSMIASYAYIGPLRIEQRDFGNGTRAHYQYDGVTGIPNAPGDFGVRRTARITHSAISTGVPFDDRTYLWDPVFNRTQFEDLLLPETRTYVYDAANRLISSEVLPGGPLVTYALDGVGNRSFISGGSDAGPYTCDAQLPEPADCQVDQYTTTPFDSRSYDGNGNLVQVDLPQRTAVYDYRNRLVQFTDVDAGETTTYLYDCLGRRMEKDVAGAVTRFYWDGMEEIEEQSEMDVTLATYVYSKGPGTRLQMLRSGQRYFYHGDDQQSVVKLTDSSGSVVEQHRYEDFGKPIAQQAVVYAQPPDQGLAYLSDQDPDPNGAQAIADDFALVDPKTITGLRWWGAYDYSGSGWFVDQFSFLIFSDAGGLPGNLICQEQLANVVSAPTGQLIAGQFEEYVYDASLSSPVDIQGNDIYWVAIVNNILGGASWSWETSSTGNGLAASAPDVFSPWSQLRADLAFELFPAQSQTTGNPYQFAARRFDAETGFYCADSRHLDTRAARFTIRTDPSGAGSLGNLFSFATNNPIALYDPMQFSRFLDSTADARLTPQSKAVVSVAQVQTNQNVHVTRVSSPAEFGCKGPCGSSVYETVLIKGRSCEKSDGGTQDAAKRNACNKAWKRKQEAKDQAQGDCTFWGGKWDPENGHTPNWNCYCKGDFVKRGQELTQCITVQYMNGKEACECSCYVSFKGTCVE